MHQRKGKKFLIYFFLLFLISSINNISLSNLKLKKIDNLSVTGLEENDNLILLQNIKNSNLGNILLINRKKIINQIDSNNLVEKFTIFKRYPSSIDINIKKAKFLARVNKNGKIYFIGSNKKLIENKFVNDYLPFIFGNPDINGFLNLKNIIDQSKISYSEIKNLFFFPSERWDLELKNNIIIKLSNNNIEESLKLALEFLHSNEFKDIKIIDARIKNQIILNG
jgi:cell division protein FtsQ|tara:strand:+ start:1909 stop:2580 length:672 start_codon:yes stop_codon:yes gene_type:complete